MKFIPSLFALIFAVGLATAAPSATSSDGSGLKGTIILSDSSQIDRKEAIFTGNVEVDGTDFKMKADTMTVTFVEGSNGKVDRILSQGNVVIVQPDRTAKSNQAEYVVLNDKITLTGLPEISQKGGNKVTGTIITIYRSSNRMEVDGHRNTIVLYEDPVSDASTSTSAPATPGK